MNYLCGDCGDVALLRTVAALGWYGFPQMIIAVLSGFLEVREQYGTPTASASLYSLRNKA